MPTPSTLTRADIDALDSHAAMDLLDQFRGGEVDLSLAQLQDLRDRLAAIRNDILQQIELEDHPDPTWLRKAQYVARDLSNHIVLAEGQLFVLRDRLAGQRLTDLEWALVTLVESDDQMLLGFLTSAVEARDWSALGDLRRRVTI